jgi:hypothetical protein
MELGSEEAIMWTQFKEEFYQEYSWNLRRSVVQIKCTCKYTSRVQYNGVQVRGRTHKA